MWRARAVSPGLLLSAVLGCAAGPRGASVATGSAGARGVDALGWMAGTWRSVDASGAVTEEQWTAPEAGSMLGTGRVMRGGATVFFEFLAIRERGDALVYSAWPRAGAPTEFRVAQRGAGHVTFENPDHDFPRRIEYRTAGEGALEVRIEGTEGGHPRAESYVMRAVR